jgi:hypothetical protein
VWRAARPVKSLGPRFGWRCDLECNGRPQLESGQRKSRLKELALSPKGFNLPTVDKERAGDDVAA